MATDRFRLTAEGMMVGTVSYMPPEQAVGGEVTPRADLYSPVATRAKTGVLKRLWPVAGLTIVFQEVTGHE